MDDFKQGVRIAQDRTIRNLSSRESGISQDPVSPANRESRSAISCSQQGIAQRNILLTRDGGWVKNYKLLDHDDDKAVFNS
jgi:hypothetical protein